MGRKPRAVLKKKDIAGKPHVLVTCRGCGGEVWTTFVINVIYEVYRCDTCAGVVRKKSGRRVPDLEG